MKQTILLLHTLKTLHRSRVIDKRTALEPNQKVYSIPPSVAALLCTENVYIVCSTTTRQPV